MKNTYVKELISQAGVYKSEVIAPNDTDKYQKEEVQVIDGCHCHISDNDIPDEEVNTALLAKQTSYLKTIKNILLFFLIIWLLGATIGIIYLIKLASSINAAL